MSAAAPLLMVPFREVRHFQPDDCLHYEPIEVRGRLHDWTTPAHRHEMLHQFEWLEHGSAAATIDGRRHTLVGPAAWMIPPGVMHGFVYERDSAGHRVSVPSGLLQATVASSPKLQDRLARPVIVQALNRATDEDELRELLVLLVREFDAQRPGRTEALQAHAVLLAMWFARRDAVGAFVVEPPHDVLVEKFRALLETHFRAHWTIGAYAKALDVTPDHLSRRCRAATGLGAQDLVQDRLMLEARRLLAYTPGTVAEIAHQLGFDDPAYFSRVFAKGAGQSPSAYREATALGLGVLPEVGGGN
jgi:AraC family transcriptional activator of pobA